MKKIFIMIVLLVFNLYLFGCELIVPPSSFKPINMGDIFDYGYESVFLDESKDNKVLISDIAEKPFYKEFVKLKVEEKVKQDKNEFALHKVYLCCDEESENEYITFYGEDDVIKYAHVVFQNKVYDIETNTELFETFINLFINEDTEINYLLKDQLGCEWLKEHRYSEIIEITITTEYVGVEPGTFKDITSTTSVLLIQELFEEYSNLYVKPIYTENSMIVPGGTNYIIEFSFSDGKIEKIDIHNGFYYDSKGRCYELEYIPQIHEFDNHITRYGFITNQEMGEVWWNDIFICEIPLSELEFIEVDSYVTTEGGILEKWIVKTEFGDLYFPEARIFHMPDDFKTNYKLIKLSLFKLIEKYSNWYVTTNGQPIQISNE